MQKRMQNDAKPNAKRTQNDVKPDVKKSKRCKYICKNRSSKMQIKDVKMLQLHINFNVKLDIKSNITMQKLYF